MKKTLMGITMVSALVGAFIFTGSAAALAPDVETGSNVFGRGPGNGYAADEPLYLNHDEIVAALVDLTGLDEAEITARIDAGETAYDIAMEAGVDEETFRALLPEGTYAYGNRMAEEGGMGRFDGEKAGRYRMLDGTGAMDGDGVPDQLNLQDGSGAGRGGRWNR